MTRAHNKAATKENKIKITIKIKNGFDRQSPPETVNGYESSKSTDRIWWPRSAQLQETLQSLLRNTNTEHLA